MIDIIDGVEYSSGSGRIVSAEAVLTQLGISDSASAADTLLVQEAIRKVEGEVRQYIGYDPVYASRTEYYPLSYPAYGPRSAVWEAEGNTAFLRRLEEASSNELQLTHIPLRGTPAPQVWIDYDGRHGTRSGSFDESVKTEGTDWWASYDKHDKDGNKVCSDGILKSHGRWPQETGSVKITYTAGFTGDEFTGTAQIDASPIYYAIVEEALRRFTKTKSIWNKKVKLGHVPGSIESEELGSYSYKLATGTANALMGSFGLLPETKHRLQTFMHYGVMFQ